MQEIKISKSFLNTLNTILFEYIFYNNLIGSESSLNFKYFIFKVFLYLALHELIKKRLISLI